MRRQMIGVTKAMKDFEVAGLTDDEQDEVIRDVLVKCSEDLRRFVMDTPPLSDFVASVTGPHDDPLQGMIHAHTISAWFDVDALPSESDAYRVHVLEAEGVTQGHRLPDGLVP